MAENEQGKFRLSWGPKIFTFEVMRVSKYKKKTRKPVICRERTEPHNRQSGCPTIDRRTVVNSIFTEVLSWTPGEPRQKNRMTDGQLYSDLGRYRSTNALVFIYMLLLPEG